MLSLEMQVIVAFTILLWIALIVVSIHQIYMSLSDIRNPFGDILRNSKPISRASPIWQTLEETRKQMEMPSVELYISEKISNVITVSSDPFSRKAAIVLSKSSTQFLSLEEIRAVLVHELYHAQVHGTEQFTVFLASKIMTGRFGWLRLVMGAMLFTAFFTPIPRLDSSSFPIRAIFTPYVLVVFDLALWSAIIIFCLLLGYLVVVHKRQGLPSSSYLYNRELFADAYSALWTGQPSWLRTALIKFKRQEKDKRRGQIYKDIINDLSFVRDDDEEIIKVSSTLNELFHSKSINTKEILHLAYDAFIRGRLSFHDSCSINERILLTEKLEMLLEGKVTLRFIKETCSMTLSNRSLPPPVKRYINANKEIFDAFLLHIKQYSNGFNIKTCSRRLNLERFNVFKMLIAAIESGLIQIPI